MGSEMNEEYLWSLCCIDTYKPVNPSEDWQKCPKCKVKPRIWVFDNGRHAKCQCCLSKYEKPTVSVESIMDHYTAHKNLAEYDSDGLRKAWNQHVEKMRKEQV